MINGSHYRFNGKFMKMIAVQLLIVSIAIIGDVESSVVRLDGEKAKSLYDYTNDKVFVLTSANFYQSVFDQPYASSVEFYNSFCGFCRSFAPVYKAFAADTHAWNDVIHVSAIDCADDANNDVCRDMEIMRYPTLRYFPPFYRNESNHLGIEIQHIPMTVGEPHLLELMANSSAAAHSWPNLKPIEATSESELFDSLPNSVQYIFLVYDPKNDSLAAQKVALDLRKQKQVQIRRVGAPAIAANLGLNVQSAVYVGSKTTKAIELLKHLTDLNRETVRSVVEQYLTSKGVEVSFRNDNDEPIHSSSTSLNPIAAPNHDVGGKQNTDTIEYVKSHPGMVFQSDLETAIRYTIFNEVIRRWNVMSDGEMIALREYIAVLNKYSPLSDNGQKFLNALHSYVQGEAKLSGKELRKKLKELEATYSPMFSSSKYIGCKGSTDDYRGYSCGLWQLFHYLTVAATNSEKSHDPQEVLRAVHGYVKHFFGCTDCSEHFQQMAERNDMWKVASKDAAVLWLWSAHNEVNRRLAGNPSDDPVFPKIQYPSQYACPQCHQESPGQSATPSGSNNNTPHWDNGEVLYYLRRVYSAINLSRYGVQDESILPELLSSVHSSKLATSTASGTHSSIFSEIDVRMGILLYAFCMLIIVVAVKLFMQRGYRKKAYTHDFWGKI